MPRTARRHLIAAFCFALGCVSSAQAAVIFVDPFSRDDSDTVGNGWLEGDRISIDTQTMLMHGHGTFVASRIISTIGLANIQLSYDWRADRSEANDTLNVSWSVDGITFNSLANHSLGSTKFCQYELVSPGYR